MSRYTDITDAALRIDELELEVRELKSALMQEEMNGMAIMECRDYIEQELGVNAVSIPGLGTSPFFDDLIKCLVNRMKMMMNAKYLTGLWVTATNSTTTSAGNYISLASLVNAIQNQTPTLGNTQTGLMQVATSASGYQTALQTALGSLVGYPPTPDFDDGTAVYRPQTGRPVKIKMQDGTVLDIAADGSFTLVDKDAHVTYRACRIRDFNRYLNASDLMEEFVRFCGEHGVRQSEFMAMPLQVFIAWLVVRAAEADGETPAAGLPALPDLRRPRCQVCKRFIPRKLALRRIEVCGAVCLERIAA